MNESAFNDSIQNHAGITEAQWQWVERNLADIAKTAMLYVSALQQVGFSREEAIQIYCARNSYSSTLTLVTPQEHAT